MDENLDAIEITQEDRLKAIAYQFIKLYERWSEDRQVAIKQSADTAAIIEEFSKQVKAFKSLEPNVRKEIIGSIESATHNAVKSIGEEISEKATHAVEKTAKKLNKSVDDAQRTLAAYRSEITFSQLTTIVISIFVSITTGLLLFWLLVPKPVSPLTEDQVGALNSGYTMRSVWPQLSEKEKKHWKELAGKLNHVEKTVNEN